VGISTVTVNGLPLTVVRRQHACPTHGPEGAPLGSTTVEAGGQGALREGDFLLGGGGYNRIASGSSNVVIGSPMPGITGTPARKQAFCSAYCALKKDWPGLTPAERKRRLAQLLAEEFSAFGAPPPVLSSSAEAHAAASWSRHKWQMNFPAGTFQGPTMPSERILIHETRHAEQSFAALREVTTPRDGSATLPTPELSEEYDFPERVVDAAKNRPIDRDSTDGRYARVMAASYLSDQGKQDLRDIVNALSQAQQAGDKKGYVDAAHRYEALPLGQDAHETEGASSCGC
jgi:uncharacterized Zn-binding protein involved in type VI secretion